MAKKLVDKITILLTPLNPRYIKIFYFFVLLFPFRLIAQSPPDHQPPVPLTRVDSTRIAIELRNQYEAKLQLDEYADLKKYEWTRYMPQVGYSIRTGFSVGYDLSNVPKFFNDRQTKRAKRAQIVDLFKKKARDEFNDYLSKLKTREHMAKEISMQNEIMDLEKRLFEISRMKYENHEITPTEYLTKEINIKGKELQLTKLKMELDALDKEIKIIEDQRFRYTSDVY